MYHYLPRPGILDFCDVTLDVSLKLRILETTVAGRIEAAILEDQPLDVAEGLFAGYMASYQLQIL